MTIRGWGWRSEGARRGRNVKCQVLLSPTPRGNNGAPCIVSPCGSCSTPDAQLTSQGDPMKLFTTFCCAAVALCSAIYAQSPADHMTVHFNTPVLVGENKIPAGDCDIQVMHGSSDSILLVLRSQAGPSALSVGSRLSESAADEEGGNGDGVRRRGDGPHRD